MVTWKAISEDIEIMIGAWSTAETQSKYLKHEEREDDKITQK